MSVAFKRLILSSLGSMVECQILSTVLLLLLRIRSAHLELLGFAMGDTQRNKMLFKLCCALGG